MSGNVLACKGVGFDLGETLIEFAGIPFSWVAEYPAALALAAEACGAELTPARLQSGQELLLRYNTRVTPRPEEREFHADQIFGELLRAWQLPALHQGAAIAAFFGHFSCRVRAYPEAVGVLEHLRERGVPFAVLTDVPYGMPAELVLADLLLAGLPIQKQELLTSTQVGHRKPHLAGFLALAQQLGAPCSEILYVGNERKDVEGGTAAGCATALLWRGTGDVPAWGQDATIRSLDELRTLLAPSA